MTTPISMFVPATLIVAFSVPLVLKLVPPNRFYGVRTVDTLANREVWFRANRFAGLLLLFAAGIAFTAYWLNPELASGESLPGVLILILPVLSALGCTAVYIRILAKRGNKQ
jgi:uncharacterized membrane protein